LASSLPVAVQLGLLLHYLAVEVLEVVIVKGAAGPQVHARGAVVVLSLKYSTVNSRWIILDLLALGKAELLGKEEGKK
jgi:hypothetical protein